MKKIFYSVLVTVLVISGVLGVMAKPTHAATATFTDDFNRADGAVGNGWTVEGAAKKTYSILNNAVRGDDAATSAYNNSRLARQETSLDQTVTVDVEMGAVSASMGALLREHGTANSVSTAYYSAGGAGIGISKVVAGTATSLWSLGSGYNTTDTYRQKLSATGSNPTTLCLTVDNITTATNIVNNHCITDSTAQLQSAGKVALSIPKSTNLFDNFTFDYDAPDPVVPSAPTNLSATPASSQVALTWSAPSSDGGASITDYLVQYKETSSGSWSTFNDGVSATTGATVTSLTNGTQYDFRVYAINSVGQGASSSVVNATPVAGSLTHAVEPEDLWDNGYFLPLDNPKNSAFSRFIFNTTSDYVIINMITASGSQAPMGVKVDGVVQPSISAASNTINLGNLGQSKQVQITTGGNAGMTPVGNSLTTIKYNENSSFTVSPPQSVSDRVLIFGDSITIGSLNTDSPNSAITPRLRTAGYSVMSEGSAGDRLSRWNQGTATAPNFTNLTNRLVSYAPKTIWLEMGHNDGTALASDWSNSVNNFGNAYAMLVDGLHSALPNAHIFCQSTMKVDSTHRLVGDKILEVCNDSSRNTYAASVDAKGWITGYGTPGTYMADAIHPNDAGNVMYANRAEEFIRTLSTSLSKSAGSASFVENQASSDLEYTVADTATNNGAKLINRIAKIDLNGSLVNPSNYSISAGSNTIILSQSYLNTLSVGTKNLDVYFTGNIKTSSSFTVTPVDATAPSISSVVSTPANTSSTITWTTNENSSSQVEYGVTNGYGTTTTEIDTVTRVTSHSVAISNLLPCTVYHYRVISKDVSTNTATSSDNTFSTTGCSGSANITQNSTTPVTYGVGGSANLSSGSANLGLTVPANATVANVSYQIKQLAGSTAISGIGSPSGVNPSLNHVYDLKALNGVSTEVSSFSQPILITLTYQDSDIAGLDESTLGIYHYSGGVWTPLSPCTVNTSLNTITCSTTSFSVFGLFGQALNIQNTSNGGTIPLAFLTNQYNQNRIVDQQNCTITTNNITTTCDSNTNSVNQNNTQTSSSIFGRDLSLRSEGDDVKALQIFLNTHGYQVAISGPGSLGQETTRFGSLTQKALIKYQKDNNISPASGYFGPLTRKSISNNNTNITNNNSNNTSTNNNNTTLTLNLELGDINEEVRTLQIFLNTHGYIIADSGAGSVGKETNIFGNLTKQALIKYQKDNNITPAVGYFGPVTRGSVNNK